MNLIAETRGLCPCCAEERPARYEADADGVRLHVDCPEHGRDTELVERDADFFLAGYEQDYQKPVDHLVLVVTYRCNLNCRYCYSLSNGGWDMPPDRSLEQLLGFMSGFEGNITLIGGEPTLRGDLPELIRAAKRQNAARKVSLATNGQKIARLDYLRELKESGLDFVFLSFNDERYEPSPAVHRHKFEALRHCRLLRLPVWLQRTVDAVDQVDSLAPLLREHRRTIFQVTLRAVKRFGLRAPEQQVLVSDLLQRLRLEGSDRKGTTPFNRHVEIEGRPVKICSWVNDVVRMDPLDSSYIISDNRWTLFHRGMRIDEVLLRRRLPREPLTPLPSLPAFGNRSGRSLEPA
jgi:MoaA/NifB/PqqE/SkfB family radical SAM enzyme